MTAALLRDLLIGFAAVDVRRCVNCCSGRRRSCHNNSIGASSSPALSQKIKPTPLSCVSPVHTPASRRTGSTRYKRHSPWICRQCSSTSRSLYRQNIPELSATTAGLGCVMHGQSGQGGRCGCAEDDDSGCKLLPDEMFTPRRNMRQSGNLSRTNGVQQRDAGAVSPSRTVLLLGAN